MQCTLFFGIAFSALLFLLHILAMNTVHDIYDILIFVVSVFARAAQIFLSLHIFSLHFEGAKKK